LETKLSDKTWTDTLSEDDVKLLTDVKDGYQNLVSQVYIFIDYFHQYVDMIQASAIFSPQYAEQAQENGNVSPTQTSAPAGPIPANRAERRGVKKTKPTLPQGIDNA
jgi:hypothetical protein